MDTLELTFEASGSLWRDALVMQDRETESLWSQVTGECIQGSLKGEVLELVSSFHTTFGEFKRLYPEGLVLKKPERGGDGSQYQRYFDDPEKLGMFGGTNTLDELPGKAKVFGLRLDGGEVAIAEDRLAMDGLVVLASQTPSVVVTFDAETQTAAAFVFPRRYLEKGENVTLESGMIQAGGGVSGWDARTGRSATEGGKDLEPFPLLSAFWFAWASFFPNTEIIK